MKPGDMNAYLVVVYRSPEDEFGTENDLPGGVEQLRAELQESCDSGTLTGFFEIMGRFTPDLEPGSWQTRADIPPRADAEDFSAN